MFNIIYKQRQKSQKKGNALVFIFCIYTFFSYIMINNWFISKQHCVCVFLRKIKKLKFTFFSLLRERINIYFLKRTFLCLNI